MRILSTFVFSILLVTTPTMLLYPQNTFQQTALQTQYGDDEERRAEKNYVLSYDDMLHLFDEIESGALENKCSFEESEKIRCLVAFLAKEGALPDYSPESLSLDGDIEDLLNGKDNIYEDALSFVTSDTQQYMIVPAVLHEQGGIILCRDNWFKERWRHVKKFVKKHKKVLIIGAVVVVAATVIVGVVKASSAPATDAKDAAKAVAGAAAAAGAGAAKTAAEKTPDSHYPSDKKDRQQSLHPDSVLTDEMPTLKSTIGDQISSFKENIVQNEFFQYTNPLGQQGLSWQENGRTLGSLFAHDSYNNLQSKLSYDSRLAQEIQDIQSKYRFSTAGTDEGFITGHSEIDRKFSTNYSYLYSNPTQEADFNTLSHQERGKRALSLGYYDQAIQDLGKAIETNPYNPAPYLERGIAHFGLGQYDHSLEDYRQYTSQSQVQTPHFQTVTAFGDSVVDGIYESGQGMAYFMADLATHPVQTTGQIINSVSILVDLVRNDEWGEVAQALAPEVRQLVMEWDELPEKERGKLAGYAFGKYGADIILPGTLAKVASRSVKSAQGLVSVCKNLEIAQEVLLLETAAEIGSSAKIAEAVVASQRTALLADELGFTAHEVGQLKQAGKLEATLNNTIENFSNNPVNRQSYELIKKAQESLKPYKGTHMPEMECRELIHKTGIPTFPRPAGIPETFRIRVSDKGAGMMYVHPEHGHTTVRVMPGKPHSPLPYQQKPYVVQMKDGKTLDKYGNIVNGSAPEAHIPLEEFVYKE